MLEHWLKRVNTEITDHLTDLSPESLGRSIKIHKSRFPELDDTKIVLFSDNQKNMDQIRVQFYEMYNHFENFDLADLGDLRNNDTNFLISLFTELLESKITPVILTDNPEIIHTYHFALNAFHQAFQSIYCSKKQCFYGINEYANLTRLGQIGMQGHLNSSSSLKEDNIIRMGELRGNIEEAEPLTREIDTAIFNLDVLKHSEIPGHLNASPCGLNAEDCTQLFRYFGFNPNLKALIIQGYDEKYDFNRQTAQLIAQCIWYFIDARNQCREEMLDTQEDYHEFLVDIEGLDEPVTFLKAKKSGRWWIKSSTADQLIPCSHQDYLTACNNEIPDRLLL